MFKSLIVAILISINISAFSQTKDQSLDAAQYRNAGLPAIYTHWEVEDYNKAVIALKKLKLSHPYSLPRLESDKSKEYFNKLLSVETIVSDLKENSSTNDVSKAIQQSTYLWQNLVLLYLENRPESEYYNKELIALYILEINLQDTDLKLLTHFLNNNKKLNVSESNDRIEKIDEGYTKYIIGAVHELGRSNIYSLSDRTKLSSSIKLTLEDNKNHIVKTLKPILTAELNKIVSSNPSQTIDNNFRDLIKYLNN